MAAHRGSGLGVGRAASCVVGVRRSARWRRPGVILAMVLLMLLLIGVLASSFAFHVNARLAATRATFIRLQTRLAAEAGIEKVKLILAIGRNNMDNWFSNPDELHRVIVWTPSGDESVWGSIDEYDNEKLVYRFSIVTDDWSNDEDHIRIGITDESSKLNLNTATREQLRILVAASVEDRAEQMVYTIDEIVDAILDWRDADSDPKQPEGDTEGEYYSLLDKPYRVKNAPFDTVEELLMVKGVDGRLLYGEDQDRNGLLSSNEDDGDETFPEDNADGFLNRGLYPYLTVVSRDRDISNDNRPRILLYGDPNRLRKQLSDEFPDDRQKVSFILAAASSGANGGGSGSGGGGNVRGRGGQTGRDGQQRDSGGVSRGGDRGGRGDEPVDGRGGARGGSNDGRDAGRDTGGRGDRPDRGARGGDGRDGGKGPGLPGDRPDPGRGGGGKDSGGRSKSALRQQVRPEPPAGGGNGDRRGGRGDDPGGGRDGGGGGDGGSGRDGGRGGNDVGGGAGARGGDSRGGRGSTGSGSGGSGAQRLITTPAQLVDEAKVEGLQGRSPFTVEDLPLLMDRLSAEVEPEQVGLININTAPALVLRCIPGLSEEDVAAIAAKRVELDGETKSTTAWLVTEDVLPLETYIQIAPRICARGTQFTVESLGYADFVGMVTRIQVILDMRGPLAQTLYYRDITSLGASYPIRKDDLEKVRVQ